MAANAASVDSWSDSEIRTKLAELGHPVGPVTQTTRKILVKKLKRLLGQQGNASSPSKQRRSLASFSSGDESQGEESKMPPPTKVRNLRRKTMGSAELTSAVVDNSEESSTSRQNVTERSTRGGTRRSIAGSTSSKFSLDTDSDSDVSAEDTKRRTRRSDIGVLNTNIRRSPKPENDNSSLNPRTVLKSLSQFRKTTTTTTETISPRHIIPERRASPVQEEEDEEEEDEEDDLNDEHKHDKTPAFQSDFMSRLSTGGRLSASYKPAGNTLSEKRFSNFSYTSPIARDSPRPSESTYRSAFTGTRDSLNSYTPRRSEIVGDRDRFSTTNFLGRSTPISTSMIHSATPRVKAEESSFFSKYSRNTKLYFGFGLFVALLALAAIYVNFGTRIYFVAIDSDDNKYPLCGQDGVNNSMCLEAKYLKGTMDISKVLIPHVLEMAKDAYCSSSVGEPVAIPALSDDEALIFLADKFPIIEESRLRKDLKHFKILALSNPKWDVEVVAEGVTDIAAIIFNGKLAARRVDLPLGCSLRLMTFGFLKFLIPLLALAAVAVVSVFGMKWYKKSQEKHKQEVYNMVNKILNMLTSHHEQNILPGYIAINNCRDELIQPIQRDVMRRVWDDAVKFIENHESRVRTEVHSIRGESVRVWRWIPSGGPPMSPTTTLPQEKPSEPILGRLL